MECSEKGLKLWGRIWVISLGVSIVTVTATVTVTQGIGNEGGKTREKNRERQV